MCFQKARSCLTGRGKKIRHIYSLCLWHLLVHRESKNTEKNWEGMLPCKKQLLFLWRESLHYRHFSGPVVPSDMDCMQLVRYLEISAGLGSLFLKSCAKVYSACHWELHQPWSPKGKRRNQQPLVSQDRRVQTHKLLTAAHQLYLPKKVAMTVAFMASKAKSGCVTKEHWKRKEEYVRLHLEVSQMTLEGWGKRDCALFFNLLQSSHAASSSHAL